MYTVTSSRRSVTPDYVLCVNDRVDEFIAACTETSVNLTISGLELTPLIRLETFFPPSPSSQSFLHTPMSACLRSTKDLDRQLAFIDKAAGEGKLIHRGELDRDRRRLGISLVQFNQDGAGETGGLVHEEIFGPVLPIIPVAVSDVSSRFFHR